MNTQRRILPVAVVRQCSTRLNDVLSKGDFERLEKILPLFENDQRPEASLAACLNRLSEGSNAQDPLSDFRAFRYRLKEAAAGIGMELELSVDSKKRSGPDERLCWFTLPIDPTVDHIADWAEDETVRIDEVADIFSCAVLHSKDEQDRYAQHLTDTASAPSDQNSKDKQNRYAQHLTDTAGAPSDQEHTIFSQAQKVRINPATASFPQEEGEVAIEALRTWVEDENGEPYGVLLGEYGIGKTTTLKQFAEWLLKQRREGAEMPLPIFIDLRYYSETVHKGHVPSLEVLLREVLEQVWKTDTDLLFRPRDILRLVREEGAILIFDGLDEKLVHLDEIQARAFLRMMWHALPPSHRRSEDRTLTPMPGKPGRLIFSCRSHYFKTLYDQNAMLRADDRDGIRATHYRAWRILPFNEKQIRDYLQKALGGDRVESALDLFESVHNLKELAPRPYLLFLMCRHIEGLGQRHTRDEAVQGITLYELVVDEWLRRDGGKHHLRQEDKLQFMEDIAADMWREGAGEWPWHRVLDWFTQHLEQRAVWRTRYLKHGSQELLEEDFRTATFVLRPDDSQDRFRFAHTSFQEYFLARYLHRVLVEGEQQKWDVKVPSPETLDFLGQLIAVTPETRDRVLSALEAILSQVPTQATAIAFRYWLRAIEYKLPEPKPQQVKLQDVDLSGLAIRGRSKDDPLNLLAADLSGANLSGARFEDVDLSQAILSGVQAERAEFHRVTARKINLAEADLTASVWRHSDIRGLKDGASATWYDSQLIACDLDPDDLPEDFRLAGTLSDPHDPTRSIPPREVLGTSRVTTVLGHADGIPACAITLDGQYLVSGSFDNTLKVWDLKSGRCLHTLEGHTDAVWACAITPDGQYLASGSVDHTVKVWDLESGDCKITLEGHANSVLSCAITPDGRHLVSGSKDETLKVWDLESGDCLDTLKGHASSVLSCAITPDGRHLVSGSKDETLKVWDLESGDCLDTLKGHESWVSACAITLDGQYLVSGSFDNTLKVWDLKSGRCLHTLKGHESWVSACAIAPDGRHLVSGSDDNTLKVWDLKSGDCLRTLKGHANSVLACAITPDGQYLASGSMDDALKVWNLKSGACLRTLGGHTHPVLVCAITPDGQYLVSGSMDDTLKIWELKSGACLRTLGGHTHPVPACAITPDGQYLVSGSFDNTLKVWDLESGDCKMTLKGHTDGVWTCAITPDGRHLVSGSKDDTLKVWDLESGDCKMTLKGHAGVVRTCAITPDGRHLVSGSDDNMLKVWDLKSGDCLRTLKGHADSVVACAITPDGHHLVSGSDDDTLKVWDLESGDCKMTLKGHAGVVRTCAITPDGRHLISGSWDKTLKVWDLKSGDCQMTLKGHAGDVRTCVITPDGRHLVSGSLDNTLKVWDVKSGRLPDDCQQRTEWRDSCAQLPDQPHSISLIRGMVLPGVAVLRPGG